MPLTSTNVGDLMAYRRSLVTDGPGVNAGDAHPRISRGDHLLRPAEGRTMAHHNRAASRAVRGSTMPVRCPTPNVAPACAQSTRQRRSDESGVSECR